MFKRIKDKLHQITRALKHVSRILIEISIHTILTRKLVKNKHLKDKKQAYSSLKMMTVINEKNQKIILKGTETSELLFKYVLTLVCYYLLLLNTPIACWSSIMLIGEWSRL